MAKFKGKNGHWVTKDGKHIFIEEDAIDRQYRQIEERAKETKALNDEKNKVFSKSSAPKEVVFVNHWGDRCHAKIVDKLSVDPSDKNFVGVYDMGKAGEYAVYKTYGLHYDPTKGDQFSYEAIRIDKGFVSNKNIAKFGNSSLDSYRKMPIELVADYVANLGNIRKDGLNPFSEYQTLVDRLNMHDKPIVLSDDEFDEKVKTDALDGVEIHRGFGIQKDSAVIDSVKFGDLTYTGVGLMGGGIYFTTDKEYAATCAYHSNLRNSTITAYLDKRKAHPISISDLKRLFGAESSDVKKKFMRLSGDEGYSAYALYRGYNVVVLSEADRGVDDHCGDFYVTLDRSALVIREHTKVR